jgi:hypothetical protein
MILYRHNRNNNLYIILGNSRILENPITGRAGPISEEALTIQLFQIALKKH